MIKGATRITLILMILATIGFISFGIQVPDKWWESLTTVMMAFFASRKPEAAQG